MVDPLRGFVGEEQGFEVEQFAFLNCTGDVLRDEGIDEAEVLSSVCEPVFVQDVEGVPKVA